MTTQPSSSGPRENENHDSSAETHHSSLAHQSNEENPCDAPSCPGECCEEDTCCDDDGSCGSPTLQCCDSNTENCNEKCIAAAAAIECEKTCEKDDAHDQSPEHEHSHDADGHHSNSACTSHLERAFEKYASYLESARCICQSILDAGLPAICCSQQNTQAAANHHHGAHATGHSHSSERHGHGHHGMKHRGKKTHRTASHTKKIDEEDSDCCGGHDISPPSIPKEARPSRSKVEDVEQDAGLELVSLIVEGMTCSGCGNKLERTLKAVPTVRNVRVNFVAGDADFDIDSSVNSVDAVIRSVERATGFRCTRVTSSDTSLDILSSGPSAKALMDLPLEGVTQVTALDKKHVRITYDPTVTGARTLLEKVGPLSSGLAPPRDDPAVSSGRKRLYDQLIKTLIAAAFTIPVVVLAWGDNLVDEKTRAYISILLATFVQLIAIPDFYYPAINALVHSMSIEMDMLVVISITAAYVYSLVAFGFRMANKPLETSEFFETSTLLITLVLLGRLVAALARVRAVSAVSLRSLQATTAVVVEKGQDREIDARLLQYGDQFRVLPHSKIPTDDLVLSGSSEVDESMLTGESVPVFKGPQDNVIAGTLNGSGTLLVQLTRLPGKNTVTDIAELVEEAANMKPKIQDVADRVASWFVPIVTSVAVIVTIVWIIVGLKVRNQDAGKAVSNAITYAVAVLAVSCPCALGLAVPMVLVVAGGIAARAGVIIKSAECTERARKVTDVVFDKTGTITEGDLDVLDVDFMGSDKTEGIAITKSMVAGNQHPVSAAVAKYLNQFPTPEAKATELRVIPGSGVEGDYNGAKIRAGNPTWTQTDTLPVVQKFMNAGMTLLVITRDLEPIAIYGLRTHIRPEAEQIIAELGRRNIEIHLVSGDQARAVEDVASLVNIPNVASQRTPTQKRDYVASLMEQGKTVMFVGDGTNDAVAVTQADVGVQLGSVLSASEVTRGAADVVLLAGLEGIPFLLDVSRASFHRMVFNFAWSATYNVLAILLAAGAFVNVRIQPAYAGLGEIVSVLPVIFAASTMFLARTKASA